MMKAVGQQGPRQTCRAIGQPQGRAPLPERPEHRHIQCKSQRTADHVSDKLPTCAQDQFLDLSFWVQVLCGNSSTSLLRLAEANSC